MKLHVTVDSHFRFDRKVLASVRHRHAGIRLTHQFCQSRLSLDWTWNLRDIQDACMKQETYQ